MHIFTDGSQIEGYINAGAGIHCELFSCYTPLGQHSTAFDGEIEAILTALRVLNSYHNKFERAVIFSDSKAAILSATSTETKISTEARDCQDLIRQLKGKPNRLYCSGYQDTAKLQGMNKPTYWPKRAPKLHKNISEKHPTTQTAFKAGVPKCIQTQIRDKTIP